MSTEKVASNCVPAPRLTRILSFAKAPKPRPICRIFTFAHSTKTHNHHNVLHPINTYSYPVFCTVTKTKTKTYFSHLHIPRKLAKRAFKAIPRFAKAPTKNQNSPYLFCIFAICTFAHLHICTCNQNSRPPQCAPS